MSLLSNLYSNTLQGEQIGQGWLESNSYVVNVDCDNEIFRFQASDRFIQTCWGPWLQKTTNISKNHCRYNCLPLTPITNWCCINLCFLCQTCERRFNLFPGAIPLLGLQRSTVQINLVDHRHTTAARYSKSLCGPSHAHTENEQYYLSKANHCPPRVGTLGNSYCTNCQSITVLFSKDEILTLG